MPFDGSESSDLDRLDRLVEILRDRSQWPDNFQWNYLSPNSCAMGLFRDVLGQPVDTSRSPQHVFLGAHLARGIRMHQVTPEMVADDLEDYLRQKRGLEPMRRPSAWEIHIRKKLRMISRMF